VGIGTSSPDSPLEIQAATNSSSDTTYLKLYNAGENVGHIDFENGNGSLARITGTKEGAAASANDGILTFSTAFDTTLSERMRIDSSGNVGIGQASDGDKLHVLGQGFFEDTRANGVGIQINGGSGSEFAHIGVSASNPLTFQTADTERLRIDSSGNLLVGTTSIPTGGASTGFSISDNGGLQMVTHGVSGTTNTYVNIYKNANGTVGGIRVSGSLTAYDTSSDYRLKENVVTDWDATTRLKQLRPSRFNFIADADTTVDGFLAHEVQDIVPEAISGTKDEMQ
jgi:hypothetical protein